MRINWMPTLCQIIVSFAFRFSTSERAVCLEHLNQTRPFHKRHLILVTVDIEKIADGEPESSQSDTGNQSADSLVFLKQ
jgi:hypothetical protein